MIKSQPMLATPANLSWEDVERTVTRVVHLLETTGDTFISLVKTAMVGIKAATGRDMLGVFAALNAAVLDVQVIVKAIKDEFEIS